MVMGVALVVSATPDRHLYEKPAQPAPQSCTPCVALVLVLWMLLQPWCDAMLTSATIGVASASSLGVCDKPPMRVSITGASPANE